jgi:hypothetical protein
MKLLFRTKKRDESHRELAKILAAGKYPRAECREDAARGDYSVWSEPMPVVEHPPTPSAPPPAPASVNLRLSDEDIERLAAAIRKGTA